MRGIVIISLVILVIVALSGCVQKPTATPTPVTITPATKTTTPTTTLPTARTLSPPTKTPAPTPTQMGTVDPNIVVSVYDKEKAYEGTTLLTDGHGDPRVIEVNMKGEIVWEYTVPKELIKGLPVGFDVELLSNGNILIVLSNSGVYEIDRNGKIVWSYSDGKVSHDADRLLNGNTLVVFGNDDKKIDAQVKEVDSGQKIVWQWFAKDAYGNSKYKDVETQGWTHANAIQRLSDGTTMLNLRNFYLTVIVDKNGKIVKEFDWSPFGNDTDPHEPEIHEEDSTLLVCLQNDAPYVAVEIDMNTKKTLWTYTNHNLRTARDCDRLPNGNVLIVAVDNGGTGSAVNMEDDRSTIIEVTPAEEIVWRLDLKDVSVGKGPGWFYKAEKIGSQ